MFKGMVIGYHQLDTTGDGLVLLWVFYLSEPLRPSIGYSWCSDQWPVVTGSVRMVGSGVFIF